MKKKDKKLPNFIAEENKHLFPEDMQVAFDYIQSNPIVFPERHLRAQKRYLKRKVNKLFQTEGILAPKIALLKLVDSLPDFLPADMLAVLCAFALECWQQKIAQSQEKTV